MARTEDVWIELPDGVRLAATLHRPDAGRPAPALLEALPYRKDDVTAHYAGEYRRLADEGGYTVARVDLRGTGSSEGLAADEYDPQEQRDLATVISWLADQPWCTGAVGMYGTSYSGFNAIQMAMERPPALKAICAIYATDDRYTDDVHYEGGALRAMDQVDYCHYMATLNALPPVPALAGERWREEWDARIRGGEPWLLRWLDEQRDGPYWRHGSLRPDYHAIDCATMIVAGWADGYRNATFRVFEQLRCPKRLLIGPWSHASTATALPGPHIDLVPEMLRWWDRWLRAEDNGTDAEPPITVFVRRSTKQEPDGEHMRGEWHHEATWPPSSWHEEHLALSDVDGSDSLAVRPDVGVTASLSCAGALPWGQPWDQRPDEAYSLLYDWGPWEEEVEVLGYPAVELEVSADQPVAFLSAKLADVFPDGTSSLISRGFLNLTHRDGSTDPAPLEPGVAVPVRVPLTATSWVLEPGHRLRLAVAGTDWPNVWAPPGPVTLEVHRRGRLVLPVREPRDPSARRPAPLPPRTAVGGGTTPQVVGASPPVVWRVEHDIIDRTTRVVVDHRSAYDAPNGAAVEEAYAGHTWVSLRDTGAAGLVSTVCYAISWPEATVATRSRLELTSDADAYHVDLELEAIEDGVTRAQRRWTRSFPRDLQ